MAEPTEARRSPVVADLTGTTVGRFHIRAKLGEGGMGQVYRADDTRLKRPVALKRISPYLRSDEHYRRRFLKEAERASALAYDHIAGVYDVFEEGGEIFIVMEYVEGETLRHRLQRPFTVEEFLPIAEQCVAALQAAHAKGIAHRDLKPENIMLTSGGRAKVLDFGVAKLLPHARDQAATESLGSVGGEGFSGTYAYASPEALLEQEVDERADIFSLGVVFYEMLAGQHPFRVAGFTATTDRILHTEPEPLARVNPAVPPELARIIHRMLAKNPAERYPNATELLADVRRFERHEAAPAPVPPQPVLQPTRRTVLRGLVAAAALVLLVVGAYLAWQKWQGPSPPRVKVAIMPFHNETPHRQLDNLRFALADNLAVHLSTSRNVLVYPYAQTVQIVRGLPPEEMTSDATAGVVADFSGSRFVVRPGMYAVGNNLQLRAQFLDAATKAPTGPAVTVDGRLEGTPEDTYYRMLAELAQRIDRHFSDLGPGDEFQPRPAESLARTPGAARHLAAGKEALVLGDFANALAAFEQVTQEDPGFALAYAWMGHIYGLLYYDERARELSEKAAQLITPVMPFEDASFVQANLAVSKYDFAGAEARYQELVRLRPDEAVWYTHLGAVLGRQGKHPEAIEQYQSALGRDPTLVAARLELATLYRRTGALEAAQTEGEKALQHCRTLHSRECEANALLELGEVARLEGRYEQSWEYAEQGQRIFRELGNEVGISLGHLRLGNVRYHQGDYPGARQHWEKVITSARRLRNNKNVITALNNTAVTYTYAGDILRGVEYYERALSQDWPASWEQAQVKSNLAAIYIDYGIDPDRGLQHAREALEFFQKANDRHWQAQARVALCLYFLQAGDYTVALDHAQQARTLWSALGNKQRMALAVHDAGLVYFAQNRYEEARRTFAEAVAIAQETGDQFRQTDSQIYLGWTLLRLGDTASAGDILEEAQGSVEQGDYGELRPVAQAALGELYWQRGEVGRARESFQRTIEALKEPAASSVTVEARSNLCRLNAQQRGRAELTSCSQAVSQARRLKAMHTLARALISQAEVHVQRREFAPARQNAEEVLGLKDLGLELRARAHFVRAQALERSGRSDEAKAAYQQAREAILRLQQSLGPEYRQSFAARSDLEPLFSLKAN